MTTVGRAVGNITVASPGVWLVGVPIAAAAGVAAVLLTPTVVVGVLGILALGAMARWTPGLLFAAYLLIPIYKGTVQPYLPVDLTLALAAANALQFVAFFRQRQTGLSIQSLLAWLALSGLITASALYARDQQQALDRVGEWWFLVIAPMAAAVRVAAQTRYVIQFLSTVAAMGVLALGLAFTGATAVPVDGRLQVLDNTIQSARAILLLPLIATTWFLVSHWRASWVALPVVGIGLFGALATGSRGPLLMFLVSVAVISVALATRGHGWRRPGVLAASASVIVAIVILAGIVPVASLDRIGLLFGSLAGASSGDSIDSRVTMAEIAVSTFESNPILGVGAGGFSTVTQGNPSTIGFVYPHNTLLQAAAELGAVGVILVGGIGLVALLRPISPHPAWVTVRVIALFFALNALVSGGLYDERMLWGLLFLLLCAPPTDDSAERPLPPAIAGA